MLLTITTTHTPATDLGYLLHKNPERVHQVSLSAGKAVVFFPETTKNRCTAALLVELDPIGLIRGKNAGQGSPYPLDQYVNDRPYAASSFLSVAISRVFSSALHGRSRERADLVDQKLPFEVTISSLPCRGGEGFLKGLFEPLGYSVSASRLALDEKVPGWGNSPYFNVRLTGSKKLRDLLVHLNVLIPVLDNGKHYWVGDDEVEKLLQRGEGWLSDHPLVNEITNRYLKNRRNLARRALEQIIPEENPDLEEDETEKDNHEDSLEKSISLNEVRLNTVRNVLRDSGAETVVDLGCGEGKLLKLLMGVKSFKRILGMDVSLRSLDHAEKRLRIIDMPSKQHDRIELIHGSLTYRDKRIEGVDAAAVVEVIEHLDPNRLAAFERILFGFSKPETVVVTTPNREYNQKFENLPPGKYRHRDHRFEWTRQEFSDWAMGTANEYGYRVTISPVGPLDDAFGAPTQMGVFERCS
ncbi:MAG: 3' terminal RNA ribose 2'-O-methyltransferase Hen1 [Gammaproteobacteria bacterium]|nr:3' terminal RNA ribose 2'-O-methyltransferase Hen1 [Gammaproteobacteria bacterium]